MFVCSAILFFGNLPVGYSLLKDAGSYRLHPATVSARKVTPPTIFISRQNGQWKITGVESKDLLEQIQKLLATDGLIALPDEWSAAS